MRNPLVLVTGFLGSGKTTLIRRLLRHADLADTAVIVNELGEVPIDHHLLSRIDEQTVLLANGCVCCSLRGDLAQELRELLAKRDRAEIPSFRRVVLETTGLADPAPILTTLLTDPVVRHNYELSVVLTTVDAMHGLRGPESVKQVAAADRIVITKGDVVSEGERAAMRRAVERVNPAADILEVSFGEISPSALLAGHDKSSYRLAPANGNRIHLDDIRTHCVYLEGTIDWNAFAVWLTMLLANRGTDILRVKGLVDVGEDAPILLNGVQHAIHPPVHLDAWPDEDHRSRLLFIGRGVKDGALDESLRAFGAVSAV